MEVGGANASQDDMADTCGTLVKAAAVLKENGAKSVLALVTHGILSGSAIETLNGSVLSALVVTNTVPLGDKVERCPKLRVIDISPTIAEVRLTAPNPDVNGLWLTIT